ncbi:MAG TPA: 2-phosphosulfolactate phosphatase [Gaiellales bacterium]|nr:2-phosphosulfolactate phosphatase [Gaiellales bacterium]
MTPDRSVRITCFQDGAPEPGAAAATVCIDVFRATTTAVTAVVAGRRCFPAGSLEEAVPLAAALHQPLLVGELGGNMPYGFDLQNSPAAVAERPDVWRPAILLSTSGTPLLIAAAQTGRAYAACLRNWTAAADAAAAASTHVEVVGAGARGEFREEDQICCAWIAERLGAAGYAFADAATAELVEHWSGRAVEEIGAGHSAAYLRDTGQGMDIDFVLQHVDDVACAFVMSAGELVAVTDPSGVEDRGVGQKVLPA